MMFLGFSYMSFEEQRMQFHKFVDVLDTRDEIFDYFKQKCYNKEDFVEEIDFIDKFTRFGQEEERKMSQEYAGVTLTTAHSSKGLEWEYVFASISDYDNKVVNKKEKDDPEIEEIRRLEFVAFTRAKITWWLQALMRHGMNQRKIQRQERRSAEILVTTGFCRN